MAEGCEKCQAELVERLRVECHLRWRLKKLDQQYRRIFEDRERLRSLLKEAHDIIAWTGGSMDFAPGGKAREGWVRMVEPLMERLRAELKR